MLIRVIVLSIVTSSCLAELPLGWKSCKRSAADYSTCLSRESTTAINSLANGNRQLGVLPLDPLNIPQFGVSQGASKGPVAIDLDFNNFNVHGLQNIKIVTIKNDWKQLSATAFVPKLVVNSGFKINGKVLVLPINGDGNCNLTLSDLSLIGEMKFKEIQKKGKNYYQVEKMKIVLNPKKMTLNFGNLFNGDKALGDTTNLFLNENWSDIMKEVEPGISKGLSQALMQISNQVLSKIPAEDIDPK